MSKVKNVSGGPLDVPLLDCVVEDGETVEVPDYQPGHNPQSEPGDPDHLPIEWPPDKWEPVDLSVKPEKAAKSSAGKAAE